MTDRYVRSTDGNDADGGSTWALAKATLAGAAAIDAAGDRIFVSQVHSESTAGSITLNWAGTFPLPTKLICGNDGAEPPTAVALTAVIATTGGNSITHNGPLYCYGLIHKAGDSTLNGSIQFINAANNVVQRFEQCEFWLVGTAAGARIIAPGAIQNKIYWKNCRIKFAAIGHGFQCLGSFHWDGGGVVSGSTSPTVLIATLNGGGGGQILIENVDFSNFGTGFNLVTAATIERWFVTIRNCKLPSGWSGSLINGAIGNSPQRIQMFNCDDGATNYKLWIEDTAGQIKQETTLINATGASDGVTGLSWKIVTTVNCVYPCHVLATPEIARYYPRTAAEIAGWAAGMTVTVTVEILRDSATNLKDNEIWLEVNALGTSGTPLGVNTSDVAATILTAGADQTSSGVTWTTTGMANPNKQKLSCTVTLQNKGYITGRVIVGKASTTVYVDPKMTVV